MWKFKLFNDYMRFKVVKRLALAGITALCVLSAPIIAGVKGSMTIDFAGGQYSLYSFLQNEPGFEDFWLELSADDHSRLMDIKGYPSLDGLSFFYDAPVNLPYKTNAFTTVTRGNVIESASIVFEALRSYQQITDSTEKAFLANYLKSIASAEGADSSLPGNQKYIRDIIQSLPPQLVKNLMTHLFIASSLVGAPMDMVDGGGANLSQFIYQLLSRSAVQLQIPIGRGFTHEDVALLSRVNMVFKNKNWILNRTPGEWELIPADIDLLSLASGTDFESVAKKLSQLNLYANSKVDNDVVRGLHFKLPDAGATVIIELPYFTVLGWGLDPSADIAAQLKTLKFIYHLPGKFQQVKKIPLSLDGNLECNFKASVIAHQVFKMEKDVDGVITNNSDALFDDPTDTKSVASCELFVAVENDTHYALTDGNGNLKIGDPKLLTALRVPDLYSPEAEKAINRLQHQISQKTEEYIGGYVTRFEAAKSLKDAYLDAAMKDVNRFMEMPVPEVMRTKETFENFQHCYDETTKNCKYVASSGFLGKMTVRHKCWDETENKCDNYWHWVETYYTEKVPQYYFKNANFSKIFDEKTPYSFSANTYIELVISASNKVCLSNNESIKASTPCDLDEQKINQLQKQQDNYTEQGLGVSSFDEVAKFDAPIDGLTALQTQSLSTF